jgi:hypothetical protein
MQTRRPPSRQKLLNLRIDAELKEQFERVARSSDRSAAEVLRELMRVYVEAARRREFAAEARRQSKLVSGSIEEDEVMRWIEDVSSLETPR